MPANRALIRLERFGGGIVDQTTTDSAGNFRFVGLSRSSYTITVHAPGFIATQQQVDLQLMSSANLIIELRPEESKSASSSARPAGLLDARVPAGAQREFERGQSALSEKKIEQAIRHLEKAVDLYASFFEAHLLLGTTYTDTQQWGKAESALRRAFEVNPKAAFALVALGEVYRRQKRYAEAEQALQQSLALDNNLWQGHFTLGRIYWEMGDTVRAGKQVGRTIQLKPDYAEAHLLAGNIFVRANLPENALVEYEEYLRLTPRGAVTEQVREIVQRIRRALSIRRN